MALSKEEKEKRRFYLLPGMGGRAYHRKRRRIFRWSVIAGLAVSAILGGILYWLGTRPPGP